MDTQAETNVKPSVSQLPPVKNKTQAMNLAKYLFGPLARVRVNGLNGTVDIFIENRNHTQTYLGAGSDLQSALQDSYEKTIAADKGGKVLSEDIIPTRLPVNIVAEKRRELVIKFPKESVEVLDCLHANEVLDVTDLIQLRDYESTEYYLVKARERNEANKRVAEIGETLRNAKEC